MNIRRPNFPLLVAVLILGGLVLAVAASYASVRSTASPSAVLTYTTRATDTIAYVCTRGPKLCATAHLAKASAIGIVPEHRSARSEVTFSGLHGFYWFNPKAVTAQQLPKRLQSRLDSHAAALIVDGRSNPTRVTAISDIRMVPPGYDLGLVADFTIAPVTAELPQGMHRVQLQMVSDDGSLIRSPVYVFAFATVHLGK